MKATSLFLMLSVLLAAPAGHAGSCPQPSPDDRTVRRTLAREWFIKGEEASKSNNDFAAIRAFQCSLSLTPHGFTAYNLAQVAERSGDLELAIMSYSQYLTLMPQANDKDEVQKTMVKLKARLAHVIRETLPLPETDTPIVGHDTPAGPSSELGMNQAKTAGSSHSGVATPVRDNFNQSTPWTARFGTAAWVTLGAGVVTLGAGLGYNWLARSKKTRSDRLYYENDQEGADAAFADAKGFAYTSYGLLAAGAVATTLGITLGLWPKSVENVAVGVFPQGGLALSLTGRYP